MRRDPSSLRSRLRNGATMKLTLQVDDISLSATRTVALPFAIRMDDEGVALIARYEWDIYLSIDC